MTQRSLEIALKYFEDQTIVKRFQRAKCTICNLLFRKKVQLQNDKSKTLKILLFTPLKTISVKILNIHVF